MKRDEKHRVSNIAKIEFKFKEIKAEKDMDIYPRKYCRYETYPILCETLKPPNNIYKTTHRY